MCIIPLTLGREIFATGVFVSSIENRRLKNGVVYVCPIACDDAGSGSKVDTFELLRERRVEWETIR